MQDDYKGPYPQLPPYVPNNPSAEESGVRVRELNMSRSQTMDTDGDYDAFTIQYLVTGLDPTPSDIYVPRLRQEQQATSEHYALEAVRNASPRYLFGCARQQIDIAEKVNETAYKVTVIYQYNGSSSLSSDNDTARGDRSIAFSCQSSTVHITHSLQTLKRVPAPGWYGHMQDYGNQINVDSNGNCAGVDIRSSALTWNETHQFTYRRFNVRHVRKLTQLANHVNSAPFRGFEAGEVLFTGWSASRTGSGRKALYVVSYSFAVRANQRGVKIAGIGIGDVDGWDYVWLDAAPYNASTHDATPKIETRTVGAYVERIYPRADFRELGVKTGNWDDIR